MCVYTGHTFWGAQAKYGWLWTTVLGLIKPKLKIDQVSFFRGVSWEWSDQSHQGCCLNFVPFTQRTELTCFLLNVIRVKPFMLRSLSLVFAFIHCCLWTINDLPSPSQTYIICLIPPATSLCFQWEKGFCFWLFWLGGINSDNAE